MRSMSIRTPMQTGYGGARLVEVSLPYTAALLDGVKYMEPRDVKPLKGTERRRARAPSFAHLVRLAVKCDSAEELGKRLRRRYQRQQLRQRSGRAAGEIAETDRLLGPEMTLAALRTEP
jgi:hypothetical protein